MNAESNPGPGSKVASEASIQVDVSVAESDSLQIQSRNIIEEQPVRIIVAGKPAATLMRTPGSEVELALGFLITEGIVKSRKEVSGILFCRDGSWAEPGEIHVRLSSDSAVSSRTRGYRDVLSSCSLCGDAWMQVFADGIPAFQIPSRRLAFEDILRLRTIMSETQPLFAQTGATHAAAICEVPLASSQMPYVVREDLGRHNALDKAVGAALGAGIPLDRSLLMLSSRLSFEMVAKAARAGISNVAGVSAPSAPAIRLARQLGMFLAGFVRGETMTVYSGADALVGPKEC